MNPYRVLAAVAADWGRLGPYLRGGLEGTEGTAGAGDVTSAPNGLSSALRSLRSLRSMERHAPGRTAAADETARFVLALLPPAEAERLVAGHPGRLAGTLEEETLEHGPPGGGTPSEETYAGFTAADLAFLLLDDNPMVGPLLGPVRERLLSYPMLDDWAAEAHARTPGLIRLCGESGALDVDRIPSDRIPSDRIPSDGIPSDRIPSFQFSDVATPWPVVVTVNGLLDAARDPWGAADWWLSANGYLGVAPAELLGSGSGQDGQLVGTARYLVEGE
ncbi:hypothetical protein ACIRQP_04065 [Streptomyces sp. NPDC102274]|uniref:hypothetical protein n=1 Tax=Streptomyces sp. NPDC102274 TaxID=3366151 RepID=UPI00382A3BF0